MPQLWRYLSASVKHLCWDPVRAIWYLDGQHFIWGLWKIHAYISGNLPRDDSEAEEDLLTLKARSESLSSGLLLWEVLEDKEGGLDCSVPVSQWQTHPWTLIYTVRFMQSGRKNNVWGLTQCTHNVTVSYFTYQTSNIRFYTFFFVAVVFLQHNTFTSKSVVFSFAKVEHVGAAGNLRGSGGSRTDRSQL